MLVRLLIAVLMLTGPLPVRFCTCAASAPSLVPPDQFSLAPPSPASGTKKCGCPTKLNIEAESQDQAYDSAQCDPATHDSHPDRHERNCPAVNPDSIISVAVLTLTADPQTSAVLEFSLSWSVPLDISQRVGSSYLPSRPSLRTVPFYISFLNLRN